MKKNTDRFVHAVFCDDIRQEIGEKMSLMGCYRGELFVPAMPVVLAKLCVLVTVSTPVRRPFKELTIRVNQGEINLIALQMTSEDLVRAMPPQPEDMTSLLASAGIMLSPFSITEPSEIRIVVVTEDGEMLGPRLRLKVMPHAGALPAPNDPDAAAVAPRKATGKKAAVRVASVKKKSPSVNTLDK